MFVLFRRSFMVGKVFRIVVLICLFILLVPSAHRLFIFFCSENFQSISFFAVVFLILKFCSLIFLLISIILLFCCVVERPLSFDKNQIWWSIFFLMNIFCQIIVVSVVFLKVFLG